MSYRVIKPGSKIHYCKLPNKFICWRQKLRAGAEIECDACGQRWIRSERNQYWSRKPEKPPPPPSGPGAGSILPCGDKK